MKLYLAVIDYQYDMYCQVIVRARNEEQAKLAAHKAFLKSGYRNERTGDDKGIVIFVEEVDTMIGIVVSIRMG